LIPPRKAAEILGIHVETLKRWDTSGRLKPTVRTPSGHRRYELDYIKNYYSTWDSYSAESGSDDAVTGGLVFKHWHPERAEKSA
jgi:hypothetical protein